MNRNRRPVVTVDCIDYYNYIKTHEPIVLTMFAKMSKQDEKYFDVIDTTETGTYKMINFCSIYNMQKDAYEQWHKAINSLDKKLETMLSAKMSGKGGSQKGGADCPENFQKIFNYMFLIAASASIAVMSSDIGLVANVCMNALKLVFKITDPIINLLRVIFLFMLQSLVSIVKTAKDVAIGLISNLIKTFYLNINTIAPAAIGIAKVFIYASLTYCGSFYNNSFAAMQTTSTTATTSTKIADVDDLKDNDGNNLPEPEVSDITHENITDINKSLQEAVKTEFFADDATIGITEERDIFMDMLTKVGNTIDAIRNQIEFGHTFLKTAYLLLCDKAHQQLVNISGSHYGANRVKLLITITLVKVITLLNATSNIPTVLSYHIKSAILRVLKSVHSESDPLFDNEPPSYADSNDNNPENEVVKQTNIILNELTETDLKNAVLEKAKNPVAIDLGRNKIDSVDDKIAILFTVPESGNKRRKLSNNNASIMVELDQKLQELIDQVAPQQHTTDKEDEMTEGGAKKKTPKRKTKKAKKRGNKRRYSRKP